MGIDHQENLRRLYQELLDTVRGYMHNPDERRLSAAFTYASEAHEGQIRRSGEPYMVHPAEVALIIAQLNMDMDSIVAALLHDVIEDTNRTFADIKSRFGTPAAELVEGVTKLTRVNYISKEEQQMENLRKMFLAMARDIRVILVKIADRLHNMRTISFQSERRRREISLETMEIYAPLSHRLGLQKIKWELEDAALRELDPIGYSELMLELQEKNRLQESFLEQTKEQIAARLQEADIQPPRIESRVKHIYSVYRKMMGQHKTMDEIYDLYAVRIITDTTPDCYNVLGLMHDLYRPIPGRFKDYISTPKPNMYQSLHTTVIGKEGQPFEIQIRTWEMHRTAEFGIAAHWKYKQVQGAMGVAAFDEKADGQLEWVSSLLESQQYTEAEEFIRTIKVDMYADEVFVFTPGGDIINLPAGAGPVDFAYAIHSAVGNRLSGAKVNGRIVPLDYRLQNGDIAEILTMNSHGPSRDWLKLVKTSEARSKIKQWFKKERREDNIAQGRAELERELKRNDIPPATALQDDVLHAALKKLYFATLDDMLAAIGYGGISVGRVLRRFRDEISRLNRSKPTDEAVLEKSSSAPPKKIRRAVSGIIVEDSDNCLIKFARCCAPVAGDRIIGYVTRGYGISVHRQDCPNIQGSLSADAGRKVRVSWSEDLKEVFQSNLSVRCHDREGLVVDVLNVLSAAKRRMISITAKSIDNGMALVSLCLEVENLEQLSQVMRRIYQIPNVIEVLRREV